MNGTAAFQRLSTHASAYLLVHLPFETYCLCEHSFLYVLRDGIGIIRPKLHGVLFSRTSVLED